MRYSCSSIGRKGRGFGSGGWPKVAGARSKSSWSRSNLRKLRLDGLRGWHKMELKSIMASFCARAIRGLLLRGGAGEIRYVQAVLDRVRQCISELLHSTLFKAIAIADSRAPRFRVLQDVDVREALQRENLRALGDLPTLSSSKRRRTRLWASYGNI